MIEKILDTCRIIKESNTICDLTRLLVLDLCGLNGVKREWGQRLGDRCQPLIQQDPGFHQSLKPV